METLFIGKNIIFLPEVDSTNSYAMDLLKNVNLPEGTVVHALYQTMGRGQRGAVWKADPQRNLTTSVILKPAFLSVRKQFFLYQITALACCDALAQIIADSQFDIKIKWPNDILVNDKKIAGILIENNISADQVGSSVIGIGINVNQEIFDSGIKATSLKLLTGKDYDLKTVLDVLCVHLEKHYLQLRAAQFPAVSANYLQHLYSLNHFRDFEMEGAIRNLLVKGVGETGLLLLQDHAGQEFQVDLKEVKWIY